MKTSRYIVYFGVLLLSINFLFSTGKREEDRIRFTIQKTSNSFDNIIGWLKVDGIELVFE